MKISKKLELEEKGTVVYTALFVDDIDELKAKYPSIHPNEYYHHCTITFAPKNGKKGLNIGKKHLLEIIGRLVSDKVDVLLVKSEKSENKNPHITLSTAQGVKPFTSNQEIEKAIKNDTVIDIQDTVQVIEGYFYREIEIVN